MIIPDYENIKEERICQECYGYTKGGSQEPYVDALMNPVSIYFRFLGCCAAAAGKIALSTSFWPTNMQPMQSAGRQD